jgi:hypothetical protein|tara:strand:- start:831 stop:1793 length:963 start_codon:yes stop_codon:yes gene_type:complete
MAQPTNTFDTYDSVGIREDLSDIIYSVTPDDTPFYTACKKTKATNTLHEWQTDSLRNSAVNAHVEGGDTTADVVSPTVRLGNYTQIFKNAVTIADTEDGVLKAGRKQEMAYQMLKEARQQKLDIEKALFENQARVSGSATVARKLAGLGAWLATNSSKGTGGADPVQNASNPAGSTTRTDGTQRVFDQPKFDAVMESIWTNGGDPDRVYLSPFQMNKALGFTGNNNQRSTVQAGDAKVVKSLDVYVTPWGTVEFMPSRENRSRDVYILQNDMFCAAILRPTKSVALAKTGDSTKRQILTELTLVSKNEAASGIVADLTTS